jgi:ferredoxin
VVQIIYFRPKCIGCNACVEAAPERWRVSKKDGRCTLIGSTEKKGIHRIKVHHEEYEQNMIAAANCPMKIIKVEII